MMSRFIGFEITKAEVDYEAWAQAMADLLDRAAAPFLR